MAANAKQLCDLGWFLDNYRTELIQDDFFNYTSTGLWTTVAASSGTCAAYDTGGVSKVLITTAATDNDVAGVKSTKQSFLTSSTRPVFAQGRLNFANQSGSNANIVFGLSSTTTLTMTDGISPSASYSGALIYKLDGGNVWLCQSSNGSTKTTSTSTATAVDGTYDLRIDMNEYDGANAQVVFFVNGKQLVDATSGLPIMHKLAYSSLAIQNLIALAQAGSANAQLLYVDFLAGGQLRSGL